MIWFWIILGVLVLGIVIRVKKRGYFWKTPKGEQLSAKEFGKRWKDGIANATPLQQTKVMIWGFIPIFAGIIWGIIMTAMARTYWMTTILAGSLPITSVQFLGTLQKYRALKKIDELMKEAKK